ALPGRRGRQPAHARAPLLPAAPGRGPGARGRGAEQRGRLVSEAAARLAELIAALEQELAPLQRAANEADWQLNVTGEQRWEEESTRLQTEIRSVLSRPEPYRVLREAAASDGVDPLLHRQAVVLANEHAPNQISKETIERMVRLESSLTGRFRRFRAQLDGEALRENHISEIL